MPPERSQTTNPQGRQKSCSECAKAKRRCGLEQPSCVRCSRQHLSCVYPTQLKPRAVERNSTSLDSDAGFEFSDLLCFQDTVVPGSSSYLDIQPSSATSNADLFDFELSTGASSLDSLSEMINSSSNRDERTALQRSTFQVAGPFSLTHLSAFAKARVGYTVEQIKLTPKMMVEHNGTPWAHPLLYEEYMPRSLQDAHAACALYVTKNEVNADHVTNYIIERATELVASIIPTTPIEVLARTHALMLYQPMLMFGGDIRCYDLAGTLIPHMEEIAVAVGLLATEQSDTGGSLQFYPSNAARLAWRSYIWRESLRRTSLSISHITTMCHLLRGQLKACNHNLSVGNRITLSAHLWKATSAFEFAVAWNNKKHFLVKDLDFTEVLEDAKPDELDVFAKMMLVGLQGIDDMKGWFYMRGAII